MQISLASLAILLATSASALPTAETNLNADQLESRQDGYCNASRAVSGSGYTARYPSLSSGGTCIMNTGASGAGVRALQTTLNNCYSAGLDVDGDYGSLTKAAVRRAQSREGGLDVDGVWGPKTGAKMSWWGSRRAAQGTETIFACVKVSV